MRLRMLSEVEWAGPTADAPVVYLVVETHGKAVVLHRYDVAGRLLEDTIHASVEEARVQARQEFGIRVGRWKAFDERAGSVARMVLERSRLSYAAAGPEERVLGYARVRRQSWWQALRGLGGIEGELFWCALLLATFSLVMVRGMPVGWGIWQDFRRGLGLPAGQGLGLAAGLGILCMAGGLLTWEKRYWHSLLATAAAVLIGGWVVQVCLAVAMERRVGDAAVGMLTAGPYACVMWWRLVGIRERMAAL